MSTIRGDVKLKMQINVLELILSKIAMVLGLRAAKGIFFVDLVLRKIKL